MQTANNRHLFKLGLMVVALAVLVCGVPTTVSASDGAVDLLAGITFDSSMEATDLIFFKTSVQLLHDRLPVWYAYLEQAKPLVFSIDAGRSSVGTIAFADCCDAQGVASLTFGYRFGIIAVSNEPEDQSMQARQVAFLGYLIHEATHIRDQRAGRIPRQIDTKVCIVGEKAALAQVLNFKRALVASRTVEDPTTDRVYRIAAQNQVDAEAQHLDDEQYWDRYCGRNARPQLTNGTDYPMARILP